jgi:hypothetical protein
MQKLPALEAAEERITLIAPHWQGSAQASIERSPRMKVEGYVVERNQ